MVARACAGSLAGPVIAAKIRRNDRTSSVPGRDQDGAAEAGVDGAAETDGAAEAGAEDPDAAGDPDGAADPEADGAALTDGTGDGVGVGVRKPPRPPSSPYSRIRVKTRTLAITK
jgi:hypothetical protein